MPQYRVKERSLFGGVVVEAGATVDYDGHPGTNLEPMDDEGKKRQEAYREMIRHKTDAELLGEAVGNAIADPKKRKDPNEDIDTDAQPTVLASGVNGPPTTIGHSSKPQVSAGGIDTDRLLHNTADGELEHDDPDNQGPTTAQADPPPKRTDDNPADNDPREAKPNDSKKTAAKKTAAKKATRR